MPEEAYFAFLMVVVFAASAATGLCQNGVFAFVAGWGTGEGGAGGAGGGVYTQAIMTGQAVAGVLPCVAQIVSVLAVREREGSDGVIGGGGDAGDGSGRAACGYFVTAAGVAVAALAAFLWLLGRAGKGRDGKTMGGGNEDDGIGNGILRGEVQESRAERKAVGMWTLFVKLRWLSMAVFVCFAVTMIYPVFTQEIPSVRSADAGAPRLLRPACFIPLAFLFWNTGDLTGRLLTLVPQLSMVRYPRALFAISVARFAFVPLYLLCNIRGRGAVVGGDFFYLVVVQFLFGVSNGYLGSSCMMGAAEWVDVEEREVAGGFMGLMLVGGLTTGSLLSFLAAGY